MKTTLLSFLLLITCTIYSQTSDVLYIPSQKTLVFTYNSNFQPLGFYAGGYYKTTFPYPYIYTTPASFINRVGVNVNVYGNSVSLMGGVFVENFRDSLNFKPDVWLRINPLRTLLKTKQGFDFSLGINYMNEFRYAIGLSIPFGGIYY